MCEWMSRREIEERRTQRGRRSDACWGIDTLSYVRSVVLHPMSAQLPHFDSSGPWLVPGKGTGCIFKGMEGAVSLKRHFQLILTGAIPVNLK